jgi:hypothetical protein
VNDEHTAAPSSRRRLSRRELLTAAAQATAIFVAGGLNLVALLCALLLWNILLSGDYRTDHDLLENDGFVLTFLAWVGGAAAVVSLVVTGAAVALRWFGRWLLAVPGLLLLAIVVASTAMAGVPSR